MNTLHLVITTTDLDCVVTRRTAEGWDLPSLRYAARDEVAKRLDTLLSRMGGADVIHWAPVAAVGPSQEVSFGDQWYCVAIAHRKTLSAPDDAIVVDVGDAENALPAPLRAILALALSRLRTPLAPFDSQAGVNAALSWAERRITRVTGTGVVSTLRNRCGRNDLVVRFETVAMAAYLKAGAARVHDEAVLTERLRTLRPRQFPETLAVDLVHDRWLYRELQGTPLSALPLDDRQVVAAVRGLVSLQKDTLSVSDIQDHLADRRVTAVDLHARVDDIVERSRRSVPASTELAQVFAGWRMMRGSIARACAMLDEIALPPTLVLSDFWSDNILVTADGIGFIDVGNSYWSYAFLSLWRFTRDVERRRRSTDSTRIAIQAFVDEWADIVPRPLMEHAMSSLWLLGRLFAILMLSAGIDEYERALGSELSPGLRAARVGSRVRELLQERALRELVPHLTEPSLLSASSTRRTPSS